MNADLLPDPERDTDEPSELEPWAEPADDTDLDCVEMPCTDGVCPDEDERCWEAFIPDEDEWDPLPDPGDFRAEWTGGLHSRRCRVSTSLQHAHAAIAARACHPSIFVLAA
jgi:hypothetical protein